MRYHALETPERMSIDLVNFLRKAAERVTGRSKEFGAGGLDERLHDGVVVGDRVSLAGSWLTCVVGYLRM